MKMSENQGVCWTTGIKKFTKNVKGNFNKKSLIPYKQVSCFGVPKDAIVIFCYAYGKHYVEKLKKHLRYPK